MKIRKIKSKGFEISFNLEMKSQHHNYVIRPEVGQPIHANSHAMAYGIIAYRALWLKAHYPPEFWASILTYCKPDKIPTYIGVAKSEGVEFHNIRVGKLRPRFDVDKDLIVYPSIAMIKGIGDAVAEKFCDNGGSCVDIDDFIVKYGKAKVVIEKLIKLGAFDDVHPNRKALWTWYLYKYCSQNDEIKKLRNKIDKYFLNKEWPDDKLSQERERQKSEFRKLYPKKKFPAKILNWMPKFGYKFDRPTRDDVFDLFKDDYNIKDKLAFEKQFLDLYWTNPLDIYNYNPEYNFNKVREEIVYFLDGVLEKWSDATTKNGKRYRNYYVTDGIETQPIKIWDIGFHDEIIFNNGIGVRLSIEWSEKYQSFNIVRNTSVSLLRRKDDSSE